MNMQELRASKLQKLSKRETEVLELMLKGAQVKDICRELNLKSNTISTFKKKIFTKTGTSNIIELFQLSQSIDK